MRTFIEIRDEVDSLSDEEKAGLATHLLASLPSQPAGPDDAEVDRRDAELDSGEVEPISHEQFVAEVGR